MPKPTKGRRLGGSSSHQKAILANLATSLFEHGRIKTTEPKARALRPYAEKLITHAKKGTLHNRREVLKKIRDKDIVHSLFDGDRAVLRRPQRRLHPHHQSRGAQGRQRPDGGDRAGAGEDGDVGGRPCASGGGLEGRAKKGAPEAAAAAPQAAVEPEAAAGRPRRRSGRGRDHEAEARRLSRRPRRRSGGLRGSKPLRPADADEPERRVTTCPPPTSWRVRPSSARHCLRRNGFRRLGHPGRAAHRRRRSRGGAVDGVSGRRCGCAPPGAPTPACMPPVRWPTSTCLATRCRNAYPRSPRAGEPEFLPLLRRLGRFLPADVRVRRIARAPAGFDARFSALRRHYIYRLSTAPYGVEPQQARYVTAWPRLLDVDAMTAASRDLLGLHDFAAFCRHRDGATTIRDLQRLDWVRDGDLVTAHVTADAFCWSMVRSLVGALLAVGEHRRTADWCRELLTSTDAVQRLRGRARAGFDADRRGLPARQRIAARTLITRDLRTRD